MRLVEIGGGTFVCPDEVTDIATYRGYSEVRGLFGVKREGVRSSVTVRTRGMTHRWEFESWDEALAFAEDAADAINGESPEPDDPAEEDEWAGRTTLRVVSKAA